MLMMVTSTEDGVSLRFFDGPEQLAAEFSTEEPPPRIWLTPVHAAEDPNCWPEDSAFLAEVSPMRLEPEQVAVSWRPARMGS